MYQFDTRKKGSSSKSSQTILTKIIKHYLKCRVTPFTKFRLSNASETHVSKNILITKNIRIIIYSYNFIAHILALGYTEGAIIIVHFYQSVAFSATYFLFNFLFASVYCHLCHLLKIISLSLERLQSCPCYLTLKMSLKKLYCIVMKLS